MKIEPEKRIFIIIHVDVNCILCILYTQNCNNLKSLTLFTSMVMYYIEFLILDTPQ